MLTLDGFRNTPACIFTHGVSLSVHRRSGVTPLSVAPALILVFSAGFDGAAVLKRHLLVIAPSETQIRIRNTALDQIHDVM